MEYPTLEGKLIMPEYGRNIQQMVRHAMTIEDREERTRCVKTIINIMGNLFPYLRDVNDFKHKLWDHLAIMSDFQLDIDFPYEIMKPENLYTKPERIPYYSNKIRYMHYGRTIHHMIEKAVEFPEGEEKSQLINLIANQMKKCLITWNKETADDRKVFDDLRELSKGEIDLNEDSLKLIESREPQNQNNQNKRNNIQKNKKK